ncbi:amino acid permease [Geomonas azotofigens]|uniref:amino acid permease n=1 Tax=Geomonas azotofigens TaxID=2843196 RepID=UPI001C0F65C8|nr:amino acid permease [Geomonas azotofigens]MBU5612299.1 amino acid permease [Geomonas azotofigens]
MTDQVKEVHLLETGFESFDDGGLKRGLKDRHVMMIALGGIIGSAFFLGTGSIVKDVGPSAFITYALGGLIVYLVMIALGELAVAIPISGSFVTYASEFISPSWAAGVGWSYVFNWMAYIPAECIAGGIIMKTFVPGTSEFMWAVLFGIVITVVNISHVEAFGEIEFWLSIVKVMAIVVFCIVAVLIYFNVIPNQHPAGLGTTYLTGNGGIFPNGGFVLLTTMVMLLVNFQGVEIIGLTAGEAKDPSKTIPTAVRSITIRVIMLFMVPVFLLVTIFPWANAGVEGGSVFAAALEQYGLHWAAGLFSFVVLTAALSCANSGLYSTVRVTWAMAREGMAPKFLGALNKHQVPGNAALFVIAGVWFFLAGSYFFSASKVFVALLSISGFTGTIAWISIIWSQMNFRKRLVANGYSTKDLKYVAPGFPYLAHLGIWSMVGCLVFTAFNETLRIGFYAGVPLLILPIIIHKMRKVDHELLAKLHSKVRFDDLFKPRTTCAVDYAAAETE